MTSFGALALAIGLAAGASGAGPKGADALAALEQNPSSAATEQVARLYRGSKDPYARLWLVDALYARVRRHKDGKALQVLWEASRDRDADVRRKAVAGLEAFRFLPEEEVRGLWLAKVEGAARMAGKDGSSAVRAAGLELGQAAKRWRAEASAAPARSPRSGDFSRVLAGSMPQVFIWVVCLQLIGYAWHKLGLGVLARSGASGEAVLRAARVFDRRPALLAFPVATAVFLLPTLGLSLAWVLVSAAMPAAEAEAAYGSWRAWKVFAVVYLASGLACFVPALALSGKLAAGFAASARRVFGFMLLALICLLWYWPAELLRRAPGRLGRKDGGGWMAQTGAPLGAVLVARVMVERGLAVWAALPEAAKRWPDAGREPGAEFWGRPLSQPAFVLWCLASLPLFSLSLAPAMFVGFKPTQLFGLWFLSNVQFAVGFGWWAGLMLSVSALGQLMILGAVGGETE